MKIPLLDKSNYYKGLLLLAGRDRIIDPRERELMLRVGMSLDFERRFCEAAIDDLLHNEHIVDGPVIFSSREVAECFFRDAIRLALVDDEIHPREFAWLKIAARVNGLTEEWLDAAVQQSLQTKATGDPPGPLAIQAYL